MVSKRTFLLVCSLVLFLISGCGNRNVPCEPDEFGRPSSLYPLSKSLLNDPLTFSWYYPYYVCTPELFEVQIYEGLAYNENEIDSLNIFFTGTTDGDNPEVAIADLLPNQSYTWRVRALEGGDFGLWSFPVRFSLVEPCPVAHLTQPILINPMDSEIRTTDATFFEFASNQDKICLPEAYNLQVSSSENFQNIIINETLSIPYGEVRRILPECSEYHWKVAEVSEGIIGDYSDPFSFFIQTSDCPPMTCTADMLTSPVIIEPVFNQVYDDLTPEISWEFEQDCDPSHFLIEIGKTPRQFNSSEFSYLIEGSARTWQITEPLLPATSYYIVISPQSGQNIGPSSAEVKFYTGPQCPDDKILLPPEPVYPSDFSLVNDDTTWLIANISANECLVEYYRFQVAFDPTFPADDDQNITTVYPNILIMNLVDCTRYYWRSGSMNGSDIGPWSETQTFFVDYSTGCISSGFYPDLESLRDTACRLGPGTEYDLVMYLLAGEVATVVGQGPLGEFWVIETPDDPIRQCWLPQADVKLMGDTSDVPVVYAPPLISPSGSHGSEGLVCSGYLSAPDCAAAGGIYKINTLPPCNCP